MQLDTARIVTGAMYATSIAKLYEETGWLTLARRSEISRLGLMCKIAYKLVPDTLCSLLNSASNQDSIRVSRQQFDLPHFRAGTDLFTFFPSTIRLWNQLPLDIRDSTSIHSFKSKITQYPIRPIKHPELYNIGKRSLSIQHTRLRLDASQVNSHLLKIGVRDSPKSSCGSLREDSWHYFFSCPLYAAPRSTLH